MFSGVNWWLVLRNTTLGGLQVVVRKVHPVVPDSIADGADRPYFVDVHAEQLLADLDPSFVVGGSQAFEQLHGISSSLWST